MALLSPRIQPTEPKSFGYARDQLSCEMVCQGWATSSCTLLLPTATSPQMQHGSNSRSCTGTWWLEATSTQLLLLLPCIMEVVAVRTQVLAGQPWHSSPLAGSGMHAPGLSNECFWQNGKSWWRADAPLVQMVLSAEGYYTTLPHAAWNKRQTTPKMEGLL